jgi:hypothetical protein
LDDAEHDATAGLALAPDNPHLHAEYGQIHGERSEYGVTAFDRGLALDPKLVVALSGRYEQAMPLTRVSAGQRQKSG